MSILFMGVIPQAVKKKERSGATAGLAGSNTETAAIVQQMAAVNDRATGGRRGVILCVC